MPVLEIRHLTRLLPPNLAKLIITHRQRHNTTTNTPSSPHHQRRQTDSATGTVPTSHAIQPGGRFVARGHALRAEALGYDTEEPLGKKENGCQSAPQHNRRIPNVNSKSTGQPEVASQHNRQKRSTGQSLRARRGSSQHAQSGSIAAAENPVAVGTPSRTLTFLSSRPLSSDPAPRLCRCRPRPPRSTDGA